MVLQQIAPYGEWESPITVKSVTSKSRALSSPRVDSHTGRSYYTETKETGRNCIVEITKDGPKDRLPAAYSAANSVYEYGGSTFDVLSEGRIIFSNEDNTVHVLDVDKGEVVTLVSNPVLRYSNFNAHPISTWVLAVEEDHTHDTPSQIKNYVVAINGDTGEVKRVASGADFYYTPLFSPDGAKLTWLEWNHPHLPFSAAKLIWADWHPNADVIDAQVVPGVEAAVEPRWGPDGSLFFSQEINGYRQLVRISPGQNTPSHIQLKGLENSEVGNIVWWQGSQTYCPLSKKHLVAAAVTHGAEKLVLINLEDSSWSQIAEPTTLIETAFDAMARVSESSVLVIGSGTVAPQTLYRIQIDGEHHTTIETIRRSSDERLDPAICSKPEVVCVNATSAPSRDIYGFLWMPHNSKFRAPEGTLPPLIISAHGGPTGRTGPGLKLRTQYFTSRGYAFFCINYTGSTGHGRDYRESLFGNWGVTDADDAAECAKYFISEGRVKSDGVGITGPSAGGYNVLQAMIRHPKTFTSGLCVAGVSDVKKLGEDTHKLESKYIAALTIPEGTPEDQVEMIYHERSPIYHASNIERPLMLIHGTKDTVVPIEQARSIAQAIEQRNGQVELVEAEGQGHMLGGSAKMWLEQEQKWWQKTLLA